jgi:hypothetical protein
MNLVRWLVMHIPLPRVKQLYLSTPQSLHTSVRNPASQVWHLSTMMKCQVFPPARLKLYPGRRIVPNPPTPSVLGARSHLRMVAQPSMVNDSQASRAECQHIQVRLQVREKRVWNHRRRGRMYLGSFQRRESSLRITMYPRTVL